MAWAVGVGIATGSSVVGPVWLFWLVWPVWKGQWLWKKAHPLSSIASTRTASRVVEEGFIKVRCAVLNLADAREWLNLWAVLRFAREGQPNHHASARADLRLHIHGAVMEVDGA